MAIRSFLAFELPDAMRRTFSAVSEDARAARLNIRWVRMANIHLTVVFMGNVEEAQVGPIQDVVGGICRQYAPFRVQVKGAGVFGSKRNPRVLWIGLGGDTERMASFRDDLQEVLVPFGIKEERRPFRPHLTLGRFRSGARADSGLHDLLSEYQDLEGPECVFGELVLFESDLEPGGAVYTRLGAWPLKG